MKVKVSISGVHDDGDSSKNFSAEVDVSDSALKAVLFSFNPSGEADVSTIKLLHAAMITKLEPIRSGEDKAKARVAATAITELEGTQMRSVKALFAQG